MRARNWWPALLGLGFVLQAGAADAQTVLNDRNLRCILPAKSLSRLVALFAAGLLQA